MRGTLSQTLPGMVFRTILRLVSLLAFVAASSAMANEIIVHKPAVATQFHESTTADFGLWVDPHVWKLSPHPSDLFDIELLKTSGSASVVLVANPRPVTRSLAEVALVALRAEATDARIVSQDNRIVCGKNVLFLTSVGNIWGNLPATFYEYCYTGAEGTAFLMVSVPTQLADRYGPLVEALLNGLQIGEPVKSAPESPPAANTPPGAPASQPDIVELNATVPYTISTPTSVAVKEILAGDQAEGIDTLRTEAKQGNAKAEAVLGLCYADGEGVPKDPAAALEFMTEAAAKLPKAEAALGTWYLEGTIVPKDTKHAEKLLRQAAAAGVPSGEVSLGSLLYTTDPVAAAGWFRKAADQDDPNGEYDLAVCYQTGTGVPKDQAQEAQWMLKASLHGNPRAQFLVASAKLSGNGLPRDLPGAVGLFRLLAISGTADAQEDYAACLWSGSGVAMDRDAAMQWFHKAADQGNINAENFLGTAYCNGWDVQQDVTQGLAWYRKAADGGSAKAQFKLGAAYFWGHSVARDPAAAFGWFQKAAMQGDSHAEGMVGFLYLAGVPGTQSDPQAAANWAWAAAGSGDSVGEYVLAQLYGRGETVELDKVKAFSWLQMAASQGQPQAEFETGVCLLHGEGVAQDAAQAAVWILKAANQGMADAQYQIGLFYENGEGVTPDPVQAAQWFRYSALQGNPRGENAYGYALAIGKGVPQDFVEAYKWFILASSQDKVAEPKNRAIVNMNGILPKMTPAQIQEAKDRAHSFVPKPPEEPDSFSIGLS